jgi:ATP-dependent helicase HrpB
MLHGPVSKRLPLPVDAALPDVRRALSEHGNVVVVAPPGSGKTTRVAPALLDWVPGRVLLLQPRRVAARLSARRIASERGERVGGVVGLQVRFERRIGPTTRLEVLTEGLLTRRMLHDPLLDGVSAVVLDEFHERSLHADLGLALLREVQQELREDLHVVVMSATLDPGPVAAFLGDCPVVHASGRAFPVTVEHVAEHGRLEDQVAAAVRSSDPSGHTLVFLPGVREIQWAAQALEGFDRPVMPLHGRLSSGAQDAALSPEGPPRVVLSTNVAETSVTLAGVRTVVDTGLAKVPRFDAALGLTRLERVWISQASADQRAGRAGRTGPGVAVRLWPKGRPLRAAQRPAIVRSELTELMLAVLEWGADPAAMAWLDAPPGAALSQARALLTELGAVSRTGLTPLGQVLARMPIHPRLGAVVVAGHAAGCASAAALAAALTTERDPFAGRSFPGAAPDDLHARVERMSVGKGQVGQVAAQLRRVAVAELGDAPDRAPSPATLVGCLRAGFPDRVAMRQRGRRYKLVGGGGAELDEGSLVEADVLLAVALDGGRKGERSTHWIRMAAPLDPSDLPTTERSALRWEGQRVLAETQTCYRDLVLRRRDGAGDPTAVAELLARQAARSPRKALTWTPDVERWLARVQYARTPDWPALDPVSALPELCAGRSSFKQLRALDLLAELTGRMPWDLRKELDRRAPERIRVPSGSRIRVDYSQDPPVLAARIQQLFGMERTPQVGGRPVQVHLLAPNNRPQQVTQDLAGFWKTSYPEIRKELRGRYPRHAWPEHPTSADAQDRPRRRR